MYTYLVIGRKFWIRVGIQYNEYMTGHAGSWDPTFESSLPLSTSDTSGRLTKFRKHQIFQIQSFFCKNKDSGTSLSRSLTTRSGTRRTLSYVQFVNSVCIQWIYSVYHALGGDVNKINLVINNG